jgi:predicted metal-binding membrane protein
MTGMAMPQQTWYGAAAGYLGMWMAMMVPMMLPSLLPELLRYRRSVRGADAFHRHGLTAMVGAGYFAVWALVGLAAYAAGAGVAAVEMRWERVAPWMPVAAGGLLLAAGGVQLGAWKARQLALCRERSGCGHPPVPDARVAWRHGLWMGVRCSLCCGNLMLALLAIGMMNPAAAAAATLAISAERLAPARLQVERVAGLAIIVAGAVTLARAWVNT